MQEPGGAVFLFFSLMSTSPRSHWARSSRKCLHEVKYQIKDVCFPPRLIAEMIHFLVVTWGNKNPLRCCCVFVWMNTQWVWVYIMTFSFVVHLCIHEVFIGKHNVISHVNLMHICSCVNSEAFCFSNYEIWKKHFLPKADTSGKLEWKMTSHPFDHFESSICLIVFIVNQFCVALIVQFKSSNQVQGVVDFCFAVSWNSHTVHKYLCHSPTLALWYYHETFRSVWLTLWSHNDGQKHPKKTTQTTESKCNTI